jgi:hypothetical protein
MDFMRIYYSPGATITRMKCLWICTCLLGLLGSPKLYAANCEALSQLRLPDASITMAKRVSSGDLDRPGLEKPLHTLPPFCLVAGVLRPTPDSWIRFEVWLPEKDWNQRFLGVGNGGFAGSIGYTGLAGNLRRGFATAGSDAGHQAEAEDASWAFGHPEKIADFGWRAVHLTAERAKDVIKAYYGKPPQNAYFDSCSDGGREALMEAQRFPQDYDGILAGAPANQWTRMMSSGLELLQETVSNPHAYISSLKAPAIERASLAACDKSDGVEDGFLSDPAKCHFDPEVLLCKGADSLDCLTRPQVESLKTFYAGTSLLRGYTMGDEDAWREWVLGHGPGAASAVQYVQNYFRYMVTGDPRFNIMTADVAQSLQQAEKQTATDLDATDPDLSRFKARGGKLIMYHGWNDPAISPWNSIAYYQSVQKAMGDAEASGFLRLYMVPGMEHCAGGPGPAAFGQLGIATTGGPKYGVFDALLDWVEKGTPAENVITTKYSSDNKVTMTRPLCPYPAVAKYKGTGDTNDAGSFACNKL